MANRFKKNKLFLILAICFTMILPFETFYAQDSNENFELKDICGGVKIINGNRYIMTKSEAQAEYVKEKIYQNVIIYNNDKNKIAPRVVVDTEINSTKSYYGNNVRISPITYNKTNNPIEKTIKGSKTFTATGATGLKAIAEVVNAETSFSVAVSATREESTTVIINPGEKFYITFTPKRLKVEGRQLHSIGHGTTTWEDFEADFPQVVGGEVDGNIYYITE